MAYFSTGISTRVGRPSNNLQARDLKIASHFRRPSMAEPAIPIVPEGDDLDEDSNAE